MNNIYVTGYYYDEITFYNSNDPTSNIILSNSGGADTFITKYNNTGYCQWATRIAATSDDYVSSITTDTLNNIYVTGYYYDEITFYNSNDPTSNIILSNSGGADTFITKYSDTGYCQWATRIAGINGDRVYSLTSDNLNNIYVTGFYNEGITFYNSNDPIGNKILSNSGGYDAFITKYSDTGYCQWVTRIAGIGYDIGQSITTDILNNIYICGYSYNGITFYNSDNSSILTLGNSGDADIFITKYSDTGYCQWATRIAGAGTDYVSEITTDNLNNIYVTGFYYNGGITFYNSDNSSILTLGNSGVSDIYITKYSDTGYCQWATHIAGTNNEAAYSLTTDNINNIYITGVYDVKKITFYNSNNSSSIILSNSGNNDAFITKYSDTGYCQWATCIAGTGHNYGYSIRPDNLNNIYVIGSYYDGGITFYNSNDPTSNIILSNSVNNDAFITKYSDTGYCQWATHIAGIGNNIGVSIATNRNKLYRQSIEFNGIGELSKTIVDEQLINNVATDIIIKNYNSIGSESFMNKKNIISISIENSVTSIGSSAFLGCSALSSINVYN